MPLSLGKQPSIYRTTATTASQYQYGDLAGRDGDRNWTSAALTESCDQLQLACGAFGRNQSRMGL